MSDCRFQDFPADITRVVFEEAARSCRRTAHSLVILCHATRKWFQPILYYNVSLPHTVSVSLFLQSAEARNDEAFFARTVRKLTIAVTLANASDAKTILGLCTHIASLHIIGNNDNINQPEIPDIRYLHTLQSLSLSEPLTVVVDSLPPNITHARFRRVSPWVGHAAYLRDILLTRPSVTHILYRPGPFMRASHYDQSVALDVVRKLRLEPCPQLRVFIVVGGPDTNGIIAGRRLVVPFLEGYAKRLRELSSHIVVINALGVFRTSRASVGYGL